MGVYNNNKDGTRSTLANTIQVVDAPMEQFVSRGEFSAVTPNDVSADNKLVAENEVTKAFDTMPTASADLVGTIVQYVGTTTANYTNGYFYKCVSDGAVTPTYSWVEVISGGGGDSSALSELTDVDLSTLSDGDVLVYDNTNSKWVNESPEDGVLVTAVLSKDTMPTASSEYEDIVVLYIGNTSANYTKGHSYLCVENSGSYSWTDITPSESGSTVTQFEVTTSGWTADSTSQSGSTLYKKSIALSTVDSTFGLVSIGATGTLPTVAQQTAYDLLQYVTIDSTVPCLYLYASAIPTDAFYIKVEGVA